MSEAGAILRFGTVLAVSYALCFGPSRRLLGPGCGPLGVTLFILVWAYFYWMWGSLFGLPSDGSGVVLTALAALALFVLAYRVSPSKKRCTDGLLLHLGLFLLVFFSALCVRAYSPAIDLAERFPDMAFLQASLLDRHFPPQDRWLAGHPLNYYYFGQLLFAPLIRLTGVPPEIGFNLAVCAVPALAAVTAVAVVQRIGAGAPWAALAAAASVLLGNLEWIRQSVAGRLMSGFSWWESSRAMPGTITEFPFFSFLLGDLHAHFVALPFMGLSFALLLALASELKAAPASISRRALILGLAALGLGVHYPLNPWQLPFFALIALVLLRHSVKTIPLLGAAAVILFLPFWLSYQPPVSSPGIVPGALRSPLHLFLLHWGIFLTPLFILGLGLLRSMSGRRQWIALSLSLAVTLFGGAAAGLVTALMLILWAGGRLPFDRAETSLLMAGATAVLAAEVVHVDDLYGPSLLRMNTVFKFYFLAWWALALAVPVFVWRNRDLIKGRGLVSGAACAVLLSAGLVYPLRAIPTRVTVPQGRPTLDGMVFMKAFGAAGDAEAIRWLRENSEPDDVVFEAVGKAYGHYGRFSVFSGRPTVLGWSNHEWVWRKDGRRLTSEREEDIRSLTASPSKQELERFLIKYSVRWIAVGSLERRDWPPAFLDVIKECPVAFRGEGAVIHSCFARRSASSTEKFMLRSSGKM